MNKKILVFAAHPDDVKFNAGGTLAQYSRQGAVNQAVIATNSDKGSFPISGSALIGQAAGMPFAESCRLTRFHPYIESLIPS
jgi:hypothetical protein